MTHQLGIVKEITGEVYARSPSGKVRLLKVGDPIFEGDTILNKDLSNVVIVDDVGHSVSVNGICVIDDSVLGDNLPTAQDSAIASETTKTVINALTQNSDLDKLLELDPTAAGLGASGEGEGSSFVILSRIVELVSPQEYEFGFNPQGVPPVIQGTSAYIAPVAQDTTPLPPILPPEEPEKPVDPPVDPNPPVDPPIDPPPVDPPVDPEDPTDPEEPEDPTDPEEPEEPEDDEKDKKEHQDNGFGNGDDDAPGNSGPNNNAENADNEDADPEDYPGNSNSNGNQDKTDDSLDINDVLSDDEDLLGNSGNCNSNGHNSNDNSNNSPELEMLLNIPDPIRIHGNPHID